MQLVQYTHFLFFVIILTPYTKAIAKPMKGQKEVKYFEHATLLVKVYENIEQP